MTKKKKVVVTTSKSKQLDPTTSKVSSRTSSTKTVESKSTMLFKKKNYVWSLAGMGMIALGLLLMAGGKMPDSNTWDPDLIYSFRRITLAPIVILAGLAFQIVAIFKK
jgi:hypothetical protein